MGAVTLYFDDKEDKQLKKLSVQWNISKYKVIKKILKEHFEKTEVKK